MPVIHEFVEGGVVRQAINHEVDVIEWDGVDTAPGASVLDVNNLVIRKVFSDRPEAQLVVDFIEGAPNSFG